MILIKEGKMTNNKSKIFARLSVLTLALALFAPLAVNAATVTSGSLTLGDSRPSQSTSYTFSASGFTTGTQIRCVQLRLNTAADGSGTVPTGLTHAAATVGSSTLVSGFAADNTSAGSLRATSATLTTPAASGNVVWNSVVNGSVADTTFYAILSTHVLQNCTGAAVDSTVVAFMYKDGALVSLTVDPTLTFTVAGVASAQTVNGATTTVATTATAVDYARTATAATNGVSAHDVSVGTNGGGFALYLKQSGNFAFGANIIDPWTGTNVAPSLISGTGEIWAYTTQDSSLGGGTATRFTSASNWAGMPLTNELVADSSATGTQLTRVGHQLGIDSATPSGNYSTTLVYTAAGVY